MNAKSNKARECINKRGVYFVLISYSWAWGYPRVRLIYPDTLYQKKKNCLSFPIRYPLQIVSRIGKELGVHFPFFRSLNLLVFDFSFLCRISTLICIIYSSITNCKPRYWIKKWCWAWRYRKVWFELAFQKDTDVQWSITDLNICQTHVTCIFSWEYLI